MVPCSHVSLAIFNQSAQVTETGTSRSFEFIADVLFEETATAAPTE